MPTYRIVSIFGWNHQQNESSTGRECSTSDFRRRSINGSNTWWSCWIICSFCWREASSSRLNISWNTLCEPKISGIKKFSNDQSSCRLFYSFGEKSSVLLGAECPSVRAGFSPKIGAEPNSACCSRSSVDALRRLPNSSIPRIGTSPSQSHTFRT